MKSSSTTTLAITIFALILNITLSLATSPTTTDDTEQNTPTTSLTSPLSLLELQTKATSLLTALLPYITISRALIASFFLAIVGSPRSRTAVVTYGGVVAIYGWYFARRIIRSRKEDASKRASIIDVRTNSPKKRQGPSFTPEKSPKKLR